MCGLLQDGEGQSYHLPEFPWHHTLLPFSLPSTAQSPIKLPWNSVINPFLTDACLRVCFWGIQSKIHAVLAQDDRVPNQKLGYFKVPLMTVLVPESLV